MPIDPKKFDKDFILINKRSKKSAPRTFEDEERDRRIWTAATILLIVFFVISFATGYDYVRLKVRALENKSDLSLPHILNKCLIAFWAEQGQVRLTRK